MDRRPAVIFFLVVALAALTALASLGCGASGTSVTNNGNQSAGTTNPSTGQSSATGDSKPPAGMVGPFTEPDYLDSQPVDLAAITNLEAAGLADAEQQVLARQSFVAVGLPPDETSWKFWQVYETARYQGLPVFVTTDSVLNAYHGLFDTILQRMEETSLFDQAVVMTEALYSSASDQWNTATDPTIKEEARLNMAFFAVADSLLKGASASPDVVADEVQAELALIEAAAGPSGSPVLGYTEDYSQYTPRGHYTRSEQLKRYFKTMMWYGHTAFYINPGEPDITLEEALSLTRRAILVASSLVGPAKEAWMAIYEPTSFLVGRADDITVDDMAQVLTQVFGSAQPAPDDLADAGKIAAVREKLNELPAPKIQSAVAPGTDGRWHRKPGRQPAQLPGHGTALHPRLLCLPAAGVELRGHRRQSPGLAYGTRRDDSARIRPGLSDRDTRLWPRPVRELAESNREGQPGVHRAQPRPMASEPLHRVARVAAVCDGLPCRRRS